MLLAMPSAGFHTTSAWHRDSRFGWLAAGLMSVLLVLMTVPEGFDYTTLTEGAPSAGSPVSRVLWLGLLCLATAVVLNRVALAWLLARALNPWLLVFGALAVASLVWSIDASLTFRRLLRLATIVAICVAFVLISWHARRFQNVVRPLLSMIMLGSLIFGLTAPELAVHQELSSELEGAWRGLTNHKNSLGALACITFILWFHAGLTREVGLARAIAGGSLALACLVLSRSSTSMATAVFAAVFLLLALRSPQGLRRWLPHLVLMLVAILGLYALAILDVVPGMHRLISPITALASKDASLTGRTEIWVILFDHIRLRPLLGSGYGAYWTAGPVPGTDAYQFVATMRGFFPGSAHNGYLEVVNDLGWLGLACLLGYLATQVRQCLIFLRIETDQAVLYLALFFQQAITNCSESHWFSVLSVDFVLMTLTTTALARGLLEHRLRRVYGDPQQVDVGPAPALSPVWAGQALAARRTFEA